MKKVFMIIGLAAAFASQAADYTLDFRAATPVASEAPVLRRAEMAANVGTVPAVAVGDTLNLKLFGDVDFVLNIVSAPPAGIAGQSFIAKDANGSASAIVKVGEKSARISVDDFMSRRQYTVRCKDGKVLIVERDNSQVEDGECGTCGGEIEVPQTVVEETKAASTKKTRTLLGASGDAFPEAPQKSVVDILVAFDQGAKAWAENGSNWENGGDSIEEFADYAVNKMNMVLEKSELLDTFCYRLVGVVEIDGSWSKIDNTLLLSLRAREGKFAKLDQLREKYGADTITLLINRTSGNTSGIGFEYSGNAGKTLEYFENMKYGCNVCDINTVYSRYTMSHETGHNMGCGHSNRQGSNSGPGRYSDSCGYHFTDANNVKRSTVMAYTYSGDDSDYYDPIPYFSTPDISPTEYGCALGVEGVNNNRSTLLKTHADTAGLHGHVLPYDWDVKFLDDNGNEIPDGAYFYLSCDVTLTNSNPDAEIYYTLDGSIPTPSSTLYNPGEKISVNLYTPKTLTACAVTNGVAISTRSITLKDGLTWSGDENGYGVWARSDSSETPWSGKYFGGDPVVFPDLAGISCATVTVQDAVSPDSVWFRACETSYTFVKGSDSAQINLKDTAFAPAGDVNFNVPVKLEDAVAFTNQTGTALTFNAPFGQTIDSNGGSFAGKVNIGPYGTLTVAPGAGKTQTLEKLNNDNWYSATSTFRVGEGTVVFNGAINGGNGVTGSTKLEVGNGGSLIFNQGGGTGYDMDNTSLTVENGGTVTFNDMELLKRTLYLNGGTIYVNRFDLMSNPGIYVTDDSAIEDNTEGYIYLRGSDSEINVSDGKTLILGIRTDNRTDTAGNGIVKKGGGTLVANKELKHSGVTKVDSGTIEVGYSSGSTVYGQGWTVASNSTLRVKSGCSLKVPSLTLDPTSIISLPAATSAPLVVNGNVDLTEVKLAIQECSDLSLGASYPFISATGEISGLKDFVRQDWPRPADGLGWKVAVSDGVLTASIVDIADADPYIDFTTNISGLRPTIPEDATMSSLGGLQIGSSPIVIDGLATNAVGVTLDVTIDEPTSAERTICSWVVNGNLVRCVVTNGVLDCFWSTQSHVDNSTSFLTLSPGRHVINVGYKSLNDTTYGGTYVYVDGTLAYRAADLRWSGKSVSKFTVGATAADTPDKPYKGLVVHNFALMNESSSDPLPNMTSSGGTVEYDYFAGKPPCVFALTSDGGFETYSAILSGAFPGTYDALSVSIVASFPENATGTIVSSAVLDGYYAYATQVEYRGNGVFAFRDNGSSSLIASVQVDADMSAKHLYTMTYTNGVGYKLYIDGTEALANEDHYKGNNMPIINRVVFGCGYWTNWMTSYNDNPNPISNLKVYASHIALGTDDRTVSEAAVKEATGYEPEEPVEPDPEPPATPAVVDVLVAYDNGAYNYVTSRSRTLEEFAQTQIERMNKVLVTNKLDRFYSYRLAGVCRVNEGYSDINSAPGLAAAGVDAAVGLRAAREFYGADTVTLLVDTSGATIGNSSPLSSSSDVAGQHECAFSACSIRAVDTGKQHTMIHENAHNMGCGHARAQGNNICSPFAYGRGFYFKDGNMTRHTIMAYGGDNDASWFFSTTSKEFGFALGDETNNNARVLKETCGEVAKWRESVVPGEDDVRAFDENGNEILSDCFFNGSLKVTVEAPVEGAELYYTFNGSEPTFDGDTWHQTSPFMFNFTTNRTLKIAYKSDETLSPVRTIRFTKTDNVPTNGLWQTCLKYPWTVEGDTIRSYNQTDYTYQCTTPLKATVVGPKRLSFSHKSYFGGATLGGANYSHFDVLVDDSPVFTQTECTNKWEAAAIDIPDGTHEVTFIFSQRYAMNNPSDNKDLTPEADDAVWLKDIELTDNIPYSSTESRVSWRFPSASTKAQGEEIPCITIGETGIVESLDFGSTNIVVMSALASLPESGKGALMGLVDAKGTSRYPIFIYANGDGTFTLYYGNKAKTDSSISSGVMDMTGLHVWTLLYDANNGGRFYCDGVEIASDTGIKWTGNNNLYVPSESLTFGSAYTNSYPLTGAKIYAVHSDFGDSEDVFDMVSSSVDSVLSSFGCLSEYADESQATKLALLRIYKNTGSVIGEVTGECVLRISEIMPKPTDDRTLNGREGMDVNGLESGWVEVENTSDQWADLADYRFIRVNRGKKTDPAGFGNFPSRLVPPRSRAIFYTSERYSNSKDQAVSAFAEGTFDGKPMIMGEELHNILVWGDKVNPKKSPYVRLYYAPGGDSDKGTVVDTVVVPSDLPEGWSIIVGDAEEGEGTRRWMCPTPTRGTANTKTDGLTRIGPNVGPLYEKKGQKKTDLANEFAVPVPPATPGEDYVVTLPVNGVMNPDGTFTPRTADKIASIKFVFRKDLDDTTLTTTNIVMATKTTDANWGDQYTATIPASYFPAAGHLIQWKVLITDGEGKVWTSPSFNNPDDGYEWYGTIVEAPELESATLPTWHMFAEEPHLTQMDKDKDDQDLASVPNYARIAIYDSSTSNYYDYVRIDLRGNTSAKFTKKSHGLRFAKAHPLTMTDVVTGETIKEIRKTSLISEFADPSYMRQMIAFWLWRKMGNLVPFDFPIRCNLNGEFYQLAFNSERFTDELIEDVYGLDKFGYSYKNVGTMNLATTTAGSIEKKTPDDEDESNISVLTNSLVKPLQLNGANVAHSTSESASLTKFVVKKFDLPAWLNYLASARITQEMDDVWANVCAYYDNPDMLGGVRGKDTWMPLGYDFNLTFGQYYINDLDSNALAGLSATNDWYKSHPLYGGWTIRARKSPSGSSMNGNNGFEAIYQSAKFRRLYLRRLRTLMDQELKEPGTPEGDTPFMSKMREMANLMRADATLDLDKWKDDTTDNAIDVWKNTTRPADMDAGIDDIWDNYVVPRREHLYVTHSVTNTAKEIGYGSNLNAGIPEAQSPIEILKAGFSVDNTTDETMTAIVDSEKVVIRNSNAEAVDMSGWQLTGRFKMTLPAGAVVDADDTITIVIDRRSYITDSDSELTDQVIIGNATLSADSTTLLLTDADGVKVLQVAPPSDESLYLRLHSFDGIPPLPSDGDTDEWIALTNISETATLDLAGVRVVFCKTGDTTPKCDFTIQEGQIAPLGSVTLRQSDYAAAGWTKITNGELTIAVYDANGLVAHAGGVVQKDYKSYRDTGGPGGEFYIRLTQFGATFASGDFEEVAYPVTTVEVVPGEDAALEAATPEEAVAALADCEIALTDEDRAEGLVTNVLKLVAVPVVSVDPLTSDETISYVARVDVDETKVFAPVIAEPAAESEPVEIEEDDKGETTVSVSISNAVKGLWYGYEVADELGDASMFVNDVPSFERAKGTAHTVKGSSRTQPSGFFRLKVLPAKPKTLSD